MAKWKKSSPALVAQFERIISANSTLERRTMFGCPVFFAGGKMAGGLWQEHWFIRLSDADRAALVQEGALPFAPMAHRRSNTYLMFPAQILADERTLRRWLDRSIAHCLTLATPPKKKAKISAAKKKKKKPGGKPAPAKVQAPAKGKRTPAQRKAIKRSDRA